MFVRREAGAHSSLVLAVAGISSDKTDTARDIHHGERR
jgi:hypothetical protein